MRGLLTLRLRGGGRRGGVPGGVRGDGVGLFGAAVGVVEHGVAPAQDNIHAVADRYGFQHLHHFLMGHPQHAGVIDIDQDIRCRERELHFNTKITTHRENCTFNN